MAGIADIPNPLKSLAGLIADFTPGVGDAKAAFYDAPRDIREGRLGSAALALASALPAVGLPADALRKLIKLQKARNAMKVAENAPDVVRALPTQRMTPAPSAIRHAIDTGERSLADLLNVGTVENMTSARDLLSTALRARNIPMAQVAKDLGVSRQYVHAMLTGKTNMSRERFIALARMAGFSRKEIDQMLARL